jgi:hypothetical protein
LADCCDASPGLSRSLEAIHKTDIPFALISAFFPYSREYLAKWLFHGRKFVSFMIVSRLGARRHSSNADRQSFHTVRNALAS